MIRSSRSLMKKTGSVWSVSCFALSGMLLFHSCTFDNEESLFKDVVCMESSEPISYSAFIRPILEKRCVSCHNASLRSGEVTLKNYDELRVHIESGAFLGAIRHRPGFTPMPQGEPKLSDCDLEKIEEWIDSGYPEN